MLSLTNHR